MHESSLIQSLVRRIETIAQAERMAEIRCITLGLGALSGLSETHLLDHLRRLAQGKVWQNAHIVLRKRQDITEPQAQALVLESIEWE